MDVRVQRLLARLADLRDEFSLDEIKEAIRILEPESQRSRSPLTARERALRFQSSTPTKRSTRTSQERKRVGRSRAVARLQKTDPAKFQYLAALERRLRTKEALSNTGELARFCQLLDKGFISRNKRDDSISALMATLATRSLNDLRASIPNALASATSGGGDEYHLLARELIGSRHRARR